MSTAASARSHVAASVCLGASVRSSPKRRAPARAVPGPRRGATQLGTAFIGRRDGAAASGSEGHVRLMPHVRRGATRNATALQSTSDITGGLLETVATFGLQTRLKSYRSVNAQVDASFAGLLTGAVDAVRVRGAEWESPLGLTCRSVRADVGACKISSRELVARQKIVIDTAPEGTAQVVFTASDFQSFLTHPLMVAASKSAVKGMPVHFGVGGGRAAIDPPTGEARGQVRFPAQFDGQTYALTLIPGRGGPVVVAKRGEGTSERLSRELTVFFRELTIDLEGPEFTLSQMEIVMPRSSGGRAGEPVVKLDLDLYVKSFPPPNIQF